MEFEQFIKPLKESLECEYPVPMDKINAINKCTIEVQGKEASLPRRLENVVKLY